MALMNNPMKHTLSLGHRSLALLGVCGALSVLVLSVVFFGVLEKAHADGGGGGVGYGYCGDGVILGFEQCDDFNLIDGDGCSSTCMIENAVPAPTVAVTASPLSLPVGGGNVTVSWTSSNATYCTFMGNTVGVNGSSVVYVTADSQFMVFCYNSGPNWATGVGPYITVAAPPPPTSSLTASPPTMYEGAGSTLTWSSTNATSCTGTGFSTGGAVSGSVSTGNLVAGTYSYSVTCTSSAGQTSISYATVQVAAGTCPGTNCQQVCVNVPTAQPTLAQISAQDGSLGIASRQISFSMNAVNPNNPPTAPVISGPTSLQQYVNGSYSFVSTDPENDTLRYLVDWNRDGATDQIIPASGYITSGVSQGTTKNWSPSGATSFQARAEDSKGALSGWTVYAVTITAAPQCANGVSDDSDGLIDMLDPGCSSPADNTEDPNPPTASLTAARTSIPVGTATTLTWTCGGSTSATISGIGAVSPVAGGSVSTGNIPAPAGPNPYQLTCSNGTQNAIDTVTITTTVPNVTISATPDRVRPGQASALTWSSTNVDSCTITGTNGFSTTGVTGTNVATGAIGTHGDTFTATCTSGGVTAAATANVTVNVIPTVDEF